jgi:hypothetical protein
MITMIGVVVGSHAGKQEQALPDLVGWRWESSLGVEILVPGDWTLEDAGCGMTARPSVVRYPRSENDCATNEPATKELAIIGPPSNQSLASGPLEQIDLHGVPAIRSRWRLPDGRFAGLIELPSKEVAVSVRTREEATAKLILDSLRLAAVDWAGCPAMRPVRESRAADATFVPPQPNSIGICIYHSDAAGPWSEGIRSRLRASRTLAGDEAAHLAEAMNSARPGGNPDPPASICTQDRPVVPDVMLVVRGENATTTVWATFSSCYGRGLDNGAVRAELTLSLALEIMGRFGFQMVADLPR